MRNSLRRKPLNSHRRHGPARGAAFLEIPRTTALRRQHDMLVRLAGEITAAAEALKSTGDANPLHRLLGEFGSVLTAHLATEDQRLYPEMLASGHRRAAATASRFRDEMGGLKDSYAEFAARWSSPEALRSDPPGFLRDWIILEGALSFRIQRENAELYPLADAAGPASNRKPD
jgi:hypothetical protein